MDANSRRLSPILEAFQLKQTGPTTYHGLSVADERRPVVFGGQIMGQMIVAGAMHDPAKGVKSLHVVFARAGTVTLPVEIALQPIHSGRAFGSVAATLSQQGRVLSTGLLLLDTGDADVVRHQNVALPAQQGPIACSTTAGADSLGVDIRIVDDVDLMTSEVTGPAELYVWMRGLDLPDDHAMHQALLSWFTDPFLIGAAMRPHDGVGQNQAHETLSTGVITHTLTFHERFRADEWLLIANRSLIAGGGRTYGEGHVFTEAGKLVASFVQTNMIRQFRDEGGVRGKASGAM
jgi:acyl-CoA thioesterase-2